MTVVLLLAAIGLLLVLRVPVAFAFLGPGLAYLILTGQSLGLAMRLITNSTASFPLLAVPLFVLLGVIANHAGIADRLFDFALALFGRVRGGLGYVSVGVSLGFSWMSGSAVADAAALSKVEIPAMLRNGYARASASAWSAPRRSSPRSCRRASRPSSTPAWPRSPPARCSPPRSSPRC